MKALRAVIILLIAVCFVIGISGCGSGISKEEHEKTVSELNKTKAELKEAKTQIAKLQGELKAAKVNLLR